MEKSIKLVVVGDAFVGKTSLLMAYTKQTFAENYETTIYENWAVTLNVDQTRYTMNLIDTAGQEEYSHLRCLGYPHTDVFLLCFSLIDRASLENCENVWLPEIRKYVQEDVPIILVGTKYDLAEEKQGDNTVNIKEAEAKAIQLGCVAFLACSALTHRGLKRVFDEAILYATGATTRTAQSKKSNSSPCCKIL
uniref:Rho family GTPase n=1 Tax=Panagrellus redivivus TaxID=6233 RepID=A0A7E4UXC9_PANRE